MTQVAEIAGVSQATVSRVVRGGAGVSPQAAEAVQRAMKAVGYHPPRRRASRVHDKPTRDASTTIALLILDNTIDEHPSMAIAKWAGVQRAVAEANLTLISARVSEEQPVPSAILAGEVGGVLLWGRSLDDRVAAAIELLPAVWLSSHGDAAGDRVLEGNAEVGSIAYEYLRRRGAGSLAFLCPTRRFSRMLVSGNMFASLAQFDQVPVCQLVAAGGDDGDYRPAVAELIDELVALAPRPDGLFLPDDRFAPMAYQCLRERGVEPGRDIHVISCNNERSYLEALTPRPATIDLAPDLTGRLAVEQLMWQVRGGGLDRAVGVIVQPQLVEGDPI